MEASSKFILKYNINLLKFFINFFFSFFLSENGFIDFSGEPSKYYGLHGEILELFCLNLLGKFPVVFGRLVSTGIDFSEIIHLKIDLVFSRLLNYCGNISLKTYNNYKIVLERLLASENCCHGNEVKLRKKILLNPILRKRFSCLAFRLNRDGSESILV